MPIQSFRVRKKLSKKYREQNNYYKTEEIKRLIDVMKKTPSKRACWEAFSRILVDLSSLECEGSENKARISPLLWTYDLYAALTGYTGPTKEQEKC